MFNQLRNNITDKVNTIKTSVSTVVKPKPSYEYHLTNDIHKMKFEQFIANNFKYDEDDIRQTEDTNDFAVKVNEYRLSIFEKQRYKIICYLLENNHNIWFEIKKGDIIGLQKNVFYVIHTPLYFDVLLNKAEYALLNENGLFFKKENAKWYIRLNK